MTPSFTRAMVARRKFAASKKYPSPPTPDTPFGHVEQIFVRATGTSRREKAARECVRCVDGDREKCVEMWRIYPHLHIHIYNHNVENICVGNQHGPRVDTF